MKTILVSMLLSVFAVQAFTAPMLRAAECPATGDTVTFRNVREVYASITSSLTTADLTKGEFETTAQFEARKAKAIIAAADFLQPRLLEGTYKSYYAKYNADKQHFIIRTSAWDDESMIDWEACGRCGIDPRYFSYWNRNIGSGIDPRYFSYLNQGIGLVEDREEVTARLSQSTIYGVFDEPLSLKPEFRHKASRAEWAHELTTGNYNYPAVVLPVPLQHAAELKEQMRVGVMVQPKEPFTATGRYHKQLTTGFETYERTEINLIVADILCAVITDQDGVVLKTIEAK